MIMKRQEGADGSNVNHPIWDIRRQGRAWSGEEAMQRYNLSPEKIEMIGGKLFWSDEERRTMLALLIENLGVDEALKIGDLRTWREAIEDRQNDGG